MKYLLFISLLFPSLSFACHVDRVIDGDTFVCDGTKVRMLGIDAPESKQAFGDQSKTMLEILILNQDVELSGKKIDKYGRTLANVSREGRDIGIQMVDSGMAWHYKKYSKDETLAMGERMARENKIGLWAESNPTPPWVFRHSK